MNFQKAREKIKSFPKSVWGYLKVRPVLLVLTVLFFAVTPFISPVAYYVLWNRKDMPNIETLVKFEPPAIGTIYDEQGRPIINLASEFRWVIAPREIPDIIEQAFLSAEDERFYRHRGISLWDIGRALNANSDKIIEKLLDSKGLDLTPQQGASTIDQQLVRLFFLNEKTRLENSNQLIYDNNFTRLGAWITKDIPNVNKAWRKIEEARLARWMNEEFEKRFGSRRRAKEEILARYLSYTYFRYVYGIKAAAKLYYNKDLKDFTADDADKAAFLAGVIKNPLLYAPAINQKEDISKLVSLRQINRRNAILDQMVENGYISDKEVAKFKEREIPIPNQDIRNQTEAPSIVGDVLKENRKNGFDTDQILNGQIHIFTTVNVEIQKIAQDACENGLQKYEERRPEYKGGAQCSAVVLKNSNGAVLAAVGGRKFYQGLPYKYSDLNRVNRARQIGSAFKPFDYLTAYMNRWRPDDIIYDMPFSISMGYRRGRHPIHNYDNKYIGPGRLDDMLKRSRNVPAVKLVILLGDGKESGMEKVANTVKLLGVKSPLHNDTDHLGRKVYYPTSALGASEMTLMELTNAYREMASGISAEPYMIAEIKNREGETKFRKSEEAQPSEIPSLYLEMIRSSLRKVVSEPGGTAYSLTLEKFPVPIAGKTGTVDDFRNALFIGFTHGPDGITVGTAINFDDNRPLGEAETGTRTALPVVKEMFRKIYEKNLVGPAPEFPTSVP